jgi:hypothetical protein
MSVFWPVAEIQVISMYMESQLFRSQFFSITVPAHVHQVRALSTCIFAYHLLSVFYGGNQHKIPFSYILWSLQSNSLFSYSFIHSTRFQVSLFLSHTNTHTHTRTFLCNDISGSELAKGDVWSHWLLLKWEQNHGWSKLSTATGLILIVTYYLLYP